MTKPKPNASKDTAAETEPGDRVGYRNPPKHRRFKKGRSGNPRGRPKEEARLRDLIVAALNEKVSVNASDGRQRISTIELIVRSLVIRAAKGDAKATQLLLTLLNKLDLLQQQAAQNQGGAIFVPPTMSMEDWEKEAEKHRAEIRQWQQKQRDMDRDLPTKG